MLKYLTGSFLAVGIVVLLTAGWSHAVQQAPREPSPASGYQALADRFWNQWEVGRPSEAVHSLSTDLGTWDTLGHAADDFQAGSGGKCLGHSEVARKSLGSNMEYLCFLAHYKPAPLRIEMLCYKADDTWTVISFKIDNSPQRWMAEVSATQLGAAAADNNANNAGN